jgi:amidase
VVEVQRPALEGLSQAEHDVLRTELKADLNAYLFTSTTAVKTRSLAEVIAFNKANAARKCRCSRRKVLKRPRRRAG